MCPLKEEVTLSLVIENGSSIGLVIQEREACFQRPDQAQDILDGRYIAIIARISYGRSEKQIFLPEAALSRYFR